MSRTYGPTSSPYPLFTWVAALTLGCSIVLPVCVRAQVDPNLVAYWQMNSGGAEVVTGNNLTAVGNVSFVSGQSGLKLAADINGATKSYLLASAQAAYNMTPGGFTFEFWVKPRSLPGINPRMIEAANADGTQGWGAYICKASCAQGTVAINFTSGVPAQLVSTRAIDDGFWHHIAATYDGTNMVLYIDGAVEATASQPGLQSTVSGGTLTLGDNLTPGNPDQFDGMIDEVRIWKVARTAAHIQGAMNGELLPYPTSVEDYGVPRIRPSLAQNHPNPFNPATIIEYYLAERSEVRLDVYDLMGAMVARLADGIQPGGLHRVSWSGRDNQGQSVASGVYFYRLETAGFADSRRMVLLK